MTTQPEALRIADVLAGSQQYTGTAIWEAIDMLRRQHEAIQKLREALVFASTYVQEDEAERGKPYLTGQVIRKALKDTEEFK